MVTNDVDSAKAYTCYQISRYLLYVINPEIWLNVVYHQISLDALVLYIVVSIPPQIFCFSSVAVEPMKTQAGCLCSV